MMPQPANEATLAGIFAKVIFESFDQMKIVWMEDKPCQVIITITLSVQAVIQGRSFAPEHHPPFRQRCYIKVTGYTTGRF